jgi:hypothetical protein
MPAFWHEFSGDEQVVVFQVVDAGLEVQVMLEGDPDPDSPCFSERPQKLTDASVGSGRCGPRRKGLSPQDVAAFKRPGRCEYSMSSSLKNYGAAWKRCVAVPRRLRVKRRGFLMIAQLRGWTANVLDEARIRIVFVRFEHHDRDAALLESVDIRIMLRRASRSPLAQIRARR